METGFRGLGGVRVIDKSRGDRFSTTLKLNPNQNVGYNYDQNFVKNTL
jgi:hypothetical protein